MANIVFGVVGPSQAGKTTLLEATVRALPDRLAIIKSLTTRARRGPQDDLHYRFVTRQQAAESISSGRAVEHVTYAGNDYVYDRDDISQALMGHHGIMAIVESAVPFFIKAGYEIHLVRVEPRNAPVNPDAKRRAEDAERAKLPVNIEATITNDFARGGKEKAIQELIEFIQKFRKPE
jgi:guanylate kinase